MLRRSLAVLREVALALPRDILRNAPLPARPGLRFEEGGHFGASGQCIALYVHYSRSGQVSEMVLRQIDALGHCGFAVVFITMASGISSGQWQEVLARSALAVQRRNFGLDFGAWRDVLPEVRRRWPHIDELMLANDSVLGPIRSLCPVVAALRSGGAGLFGLTESLQGGPHLQSYMLLARGPRAVSDLMRFILTLYVSHSKWLLIRFSELRLARWMRDRNHRVAALFGYDRLVRAAVTDQDQCRRLATAHPALSDLQQLTQEAAVARLRQWPVNPTRHLWHILATRFGYPFVKTDLVLRGLTGCGGLDSWDSVVPHDAPCPLPVLRAHLEVLRSGPTGPPN